MAPSGDTFFCTLKAFDADDHNSLNLKLGKIRHFSFTQNKERSAP